MVHRTGRRTGTISTLRPSIHVRYTQAEAAQQWIHRRGQAGERMYGTSTLRPDSGAKVNLSPLSTAILHFDSLISMADFIPNSAIFRTLGRSWASP